MRALCFQFRVCSLEYFLDRMRLYEVEDYLENIEYLDMNSWEQARTLAYITAQVNSTKELTPKDIMKLPWDKEEKASAEDITEAKNNLAISKALMGIV